MTGLIRPYDPLFRELKELNGTLGERVEEEEGAAFSPVL
jgi:hypothetical protein